MIGAAASPYDKRYWQQCTSELDLAEWAVLCGYAALHDGTGTHQRCLMQHHSMGLVQPARRRSVSSCIYVGKLLHLYVAAQQQHGARIAVRVEMLGCNSGSGCRRKIVVCLKEVCAVLKCSSHCCLIVNKTNRKQPGVKDEPVQTYR